MFRCVSSDSHMFVFSSPTCPAPQQDFCRNAHHPGSGAAQLAVVWDLRLHGDPGGSTSITGTARFMLASFYIVITSLSGHTRGTSILIHAANRNKCTPQAQKSWGDTWLRNLWNSFTTSSTSSLCCSNSMPLVASSSVDTKMGVSVRTARALSLIHISEPTRRT